jgi:cell filamentation protein
MAYSIEGSNHACYEGTLCLVNKLDIRDEALLATVEGGITLLKAAELETHPLPGIFNFEHYKRTHQYLFEDIFDWAGEIRDVDISKKGTYFVGADEIAHIAPSLFARVELLGHARKRRFSDYVKQIAQLYHEVNMLHPFREGNGRTQRSFFTQLIRAVGYDIHFGNCDTDFLTIATIQAAHGVQDYLQQFFAEAIQKN